MKYIIQEPDLIVSMSFIIPGSINTLCTILNII